MFVWTYMRVKYTQLVWDYEMKLCRTYLWEDHNGNILRTRGERIEE